jgi:hypothetical protein
MDLKVSSMSKLEAGTVELPGKNVRTKCGMNKAILDQRWARNSAHSSKAGMEAAGSSSPCQLSNEPDMCH